MWAAGGSFTPDGLLSVGTTLFVALLSTVVALVIALWQSREARRKHGREADAWQRQWEELGERLDLQYRERIARLDKQADADREEIRRLNRLLNTRSGNDRK